MSLKTLAGTIFKDRYRSWRGKSGRRYIFSVYGRAAGTGDFSECPHFANGVVIAASRREDGTARIHWIGQSGSFPELLFEGPHLHEACARGATELHVHLLAGRRIDRDAIVEDLSA
jgi:hypothetical protein